MTNNAATRIPTPDVTASNKPTVGVAAVRSPIPPMPQRDCWTAMEDYAGLVSDRTNMRAVPLPLISSEAAAVAARLSQLPVCLDAVLLIGLDATTAGQVQTAVGAAGGPPVITELDATTVAVAAAACAVLRDRGVTSRRGEIVVTGPENAPRLGPLLAALGIAAMTTWRRYDAEDYPLRRLMAHNDVLIDLAGIGDERAAPGRTLRMPADPYDFGALVVPGLLAGLCGQGRSPVTIELFTACARALTLLTPTNQVLPDLNERLLVPAITSRIHRTLATTPA
ncbi:hypothetical protein [Mycolicibacterium lutetiense]|uniref:Uncharacterized protein n=1 Tax=Mycolicibacterium lutetiense TaxID=1641992 RepID=A0ABS4ZSG8_9MYCO|nr:hypothetical protein [Mycolicibacterium lutetiense]MBP2452418.1 hypothetical protein [Mycolicibacterium lutetiense]